jgi:hypothetical protein
LLVDFVAAHTSPIWLPFEGVFGADIDYATTGQI